MIYRFQLYIYIFLVCLAFLLVMPFFVAIFFYIDLLIFISLSILASCNCIGFIRDLIQFNVAGIPEIHKTSSFPFDPDEGLRKSREYQEVNGRFGEKAIERLGLGNDGKELERLEQQRRRDQGQLGGVREYLP